MPTYSYSCDKCQHNFELFFHIAEYKSSPKCVACGNGSTHREYIQDIATQHASVRKADNELRTIGDLANRNRDKLSNDQKNALHQKHNAYKEETPQKQLPSGMTRLKKQPKIKWT